MSAASKPLSRTDKIRTLKALQEKERRQRSAPLLQANCKFSDPQRDAIRALQSREFRILVLGGGNRMGKSHLLAVFLVCLVYGYWIFDVPDLQLTDDGDYPSRDQVDPKYWIYRTDGVPFANPARILVLSGLPFQRGVGTILWPKIEGFFPPAVRRNPAFRVQRGQYSVPIRFLAPNSTEVIFGSGEQSTMAFEGIDLDAVLNDEPIPRAFWAPLWRGLTDRHGLVFFSMTPIGANAPWIHDEILLRNDTCFMTGSIWSNPFLPDHSKREFLDGLHCSEEELQARETGAFSLQSVRAFPTMDRSVHIVPTREVTRGWIHLCICDPAHRRPFFFIWLAKGPHGEHEVYHEWPRGVDYMQLRSSDKTIRDYGTMVRDTEGSRPVDGRVLDPRFGKAEHSVKGQKQTSIQEDFARDAGLFFDCNVPGTEREETGIQAIRNLLSWDKHAPISELNSPKLVVQEHCTNTIAMLEKSTFVPPNARDPQILKEELTEAWKDPRDCLRYGVLYPVIFHDLYQDGYIPQDDLDREDEYEI
jgi:hypothetical protein